MNCLLESRVCIVFSEYGRSEYTGMLAHLNIIFTINAPPDAYVCAFVCVCVVLSLGIFLEKHRICHLFG